MPGSATADPALVRWDRVLEAESLLSAVQERDSRLRAVPTRLSAAADRLAAALEDDSPPRTLLTDIATRLASPLERIILSPRTRLVRDHRMLPLHTAHRWDARTRRWYARRAGATPLEKAGAEGRLLAVVRDHSADVIENRILVWVGGVLEPRLAAYLGACRPQSADPPHVANARRLARGLRALRAHPALGSVAPITGGARPTNALLHDPAYRAVWDVYQILANEDDVAQQLWDALPSTIADLTALLAVSVLNAHLSRIVDAPTLVAPASSGASTRIHSYGRWSGAQAVDDGHVSVHIHRTESRVSVHVSGTTEQQWSAPAWDDDSSPSTYLRTLREQLREWLTGVVHASAPPRLDSATRRDVVVHDGPFTGRGGLLSDVHGSLRRRSYHFTDWSHAVPDAVIRTACSLWAEAGRDPSALRALLGSSTEARERVLVVGEETDLEAAAALATGAARQWLLPRSIATVLGWWETHATEHSQLRKVGVICLGGLAPTANIVERAESDGLDEWVHRPPVATLDWRMEKLEELVAEQIRRDGIRPESIPSTRARFWRELALRGSHRVRLPVLDEDVWRFVAVPEEIVRESLRSLLAFVAASSGGHGAEMWLVEGWPTRDAWFRSELQSGAAHAPLQIVDRETVARGACVFRERVHSGPTYVDIAPRVELKVNVDGQPHWHVVTEGGRMKPGTAPSKSISMLMPRGRSAVVLPIRVDGEEKPTVARWEPRHELEEPVDVVLRSEWRTGFGGLRVELKPRRADAPMGAIVLDLASRDAVRVDNVYPEPVRRAPYGPRNVQAAQALAEATIKTLKSLVNDSSRVDDLKRSARELCRALPGTRFEVSEDVARAFEPLRLRAEAVACIWLDLRATRAARETVRIDIRDKHVRKQLENAREIAWRVASGLGASQPRSIVEAALDLLEERRNTSKVSKRDLDAVLQVIAAYSDGSDDEHVKVLRRFASLELDGDRVAWAKALGLTLLVYPCAAKALDDSTIGTLSDHVARLGDDLVAKPKLDPAESGALAQLLLGVLRIREEGEEQYGPRSDWSREMLGRIERWQAARPELADAITGLHLPEGQRAWEVMRAQFAGSGTRLLVSLEGEST